MSIVRVIHNRENPFVQLNKAALWSPNLSLKAVGLWARCMSRPDNWSFNVKELVSKSKEGRRAIDAAIQELIENNYAMRLEHYEKKEDGKFTGGGVEYIFFEFPATQEEKENHIQEFKKSFRHCGFGDCRNGDCRNDELLINNPKQTKASKEKEEPDFAPQASHLSFLLLDAIKKTLPGLKEPKNDLWVREFDRMLRIDCRDTSLIEKVLKWLPTNEFWASNVLSAKALRKQFDRLVAEMNRTSKSKPKDQDNQAWAKSACAIINHPDIETTPEGMIFINRGAGQSPFIAFKENGFKEQVLARLRKMNIKTEGLE